MTNPSVDVALGLIAEELDSATEKFGPFASPHEGIGIILEEFLELLWAVFWGKGDPMAEATQVGAMAARFLIDCSGVGRAIEEPLTEEAATAEVAEALGGAVPKEGDPRGRSPGVVLFKILAETLEKAYKQVGAMEPGDHPAPDRVRQEEALANLLRAYRMVRDVTDALGGAKQGGNDGDSPEARD